MFAAPAEAGMTEAEELREVNFKEFEDRIRFMSGIAECGSGREY